MRRLRLFTWHVHGSYLFYLARTGHEIVVPLKPGRPPGYVGLPPGNFPWPPTLREVPADAVRRLDFDAVLFQAREHWERDQDEILSAEQRRLPRLYLEHDPPRTSPTDARHWVDDPEVLLVHVTPFNALMWDSGRTPTRVIEHGVVVPESVRYTGELPRALCVVNDIRARGRRLGGDVLDAWRGALPIDLVGMGSTAAGGLGEIPHRALPAFEARYRVLVNPIRWTSLGLAVCEAMMIGMPVVALATTEMATVVENGVSGFAGTDPAWLADRIRDCLDDPALAHRLGEGARRTARARFGIERFVADWNRALADAAGLPAAAARATA
ncbi:MAG TPA: glycosyltransferase [Thermodesulfobacteriota bacterium]